MLVLNRKEGESITIHTKDGDVVVQVVRIYGNRVMVGIEAPKTIPILRGELVKKEDRAA